MKMCNQCKKCDGDRCTYFDNDSDRESTIACILFEPKKLTNGDRIRAMSDEELANWGMYDLGTCPTFEKHQTCPKFGDCSASEIEQCWLNWLKQEGKNE